MKHDAVGLGAVGVRNDGAVDRSSRRMDSAYPVPKGGLPGRGAVARTASETQGEGRPVTTEVCASSLSERIIERVKDRVGNEVFRRFVQRQVTVEATDEGVSVSATTPFAAERLARRFGAAFNEALRLETGDPDATVRLRVAPAKRRDSGEVNKRGSTSPAQSGAPVSPRRVEPMSARRRRLGSRAASHPMHSLDTFVVGRCNQLAHRATLALTAPQRPIGFNIVFVHGACGVGKTHLLQGAVQHYRRENPAPRVLYTTGEAFTNAFISAVRGGDINAFRKKHRGLDLLCIDDIHFLSNKTQTQVEFLHTFDAMDLDGARIMLASDEHPARIKQFSRELVSRFSAGMVVAMDLPDPVTRRRLIESLALKRGLVLREDAISLIAERCPGSVREIEGALTRIDAVRRLLPEGRAMGGPLDAASVRLAMGPERKTRAPRPLKVEAIAQCIAETVGVSMPELMGKSRHKRVVVVRSMTAYLARKLTSQSYPEIAQAMGRPNHSTVVTACKRVEKKIALRERCDQDLHSLAQTWGELADELERCVRTTLGAA